VGLLFPLAVEQLDVILCGSCMQLVSVSCLWSWCMSADGASLSTAEPVAMTAAPWACQQHNLYRSCRNRILWLGSALISSTLIFLKEGKQMKRLTQ